MKADKGNQVIVMNKNEYDERMLTSIQEDNFKVSRRSPLNKMINDARSVIDNLNQVFNVNKFRLRMSNPKVPLMYGLPKVHKPGNKMRKIVSCVNSPFANISKWLVAELKQYLPFEGFAVKNSFEFADKIKDIQIEEDETLISFDVTALFPSVPINIAIKVIKKHLVHKAVSNEHINAFINAIEKCMTYNSFQFRNQFYSNDFGCSMGNSLSPLVAEAFMSNFETDLKKEGLLPRIWWRYVDDTFAVVKKANVESILNTLNNRYESIKFTYELESEDDHSLPFLDLKITRNDGKVQFAVYRKSTSTDRFITFDSYCNHQNKIAAFHSMVYRLCRLPLSLHNYKLEYEHILHLATINGYNKHLIDNLIIKHSNKIRKRNLSTLFAQNVFSNKTDQRRVAIAFVPNVTNKLHKYYEKSNIKIVHTNNNKLRLSLGTTKDSIPMLERSGVYKITCKDCDASYIGQTRRALKTRASEHERTIDNKEIQKAIPSHIFNFDNTESHSVTPIIDNIKILKTVNNPSKLDAYESFFIQTTNNLMNLEAGAIESSLFNSF